MNKFAFYLVSYTTALFNSVNSALFVLAPSIIDIPDTDDVGLYTWGGGGGGGGTPIYGLYRYVPRDRVCFLRFSVLK